MTRRFPLVLTALLVTTAAAAGIPPEWLTPAEKSGFTATASYAETEAFLERVAARLPEVRLATFGTSPQGRALPLVIVSKERAFTPAEAAAVGKPVVLVQNAIHAGEPDGTDAALMLLRDLALGRRRELLDAATLLIVPIYNVDGHERVSPYNRANQTGPEANLGFRTSADGLDLNRDFMKAAAPETRALLGLVAAWNPDLHVDVHVTDGSDFDWVLTATWAEAPQVPEEVDAWLRRHMPPVLAATQAAGHRCGPYVDLVDRNDPAKGFSSWVGGPRYATGYFPLRNRPSVLLEMHAYKPYGKRVLAVRDFLVALLGELGRDGGALHRAVSTADARVVALGGPGAVPSDVVLSWRETGPPDAIAFPIYAWDTVTSPVTGTPLIRYRRGEVHELTVPWFHRVVAELSVARPRGYLVPSGWPAVEACLAAHHLRVERLTAPAEPEVETIRVADPRFAASTYQGLTRVTATVTRRRERRRVPAGTLWIGADQPGFDVAAQLLEPDAPDSLFAWGLVSQVLEHKEYIGPRRLDEVAREMLDDPAVASAWRAALADPAFAADPRARREWWYERTPYYAVQEVGLIPAMRVMAPATLVTAPWPGPRPSP